MVGELICAMMEGKGRGVIARHSIAASDLLLCARPAVVLEGPPDPEGAPDAARLVPALVQAANAQDVPQIRAALQYLYDGTDASRLQLPDIRTMMNLAKHSSSSSSSSSSSLQEGLQESCCDHDHSSGHHHHHHDSHSHSAAEPAAADADKLTEQQASLLVKYNAFADDYEDLAAAAVRGAAMPHSHVGLWPQFALFNHSCLPNSVHYLVGHAMVVRAVEDVAAGEELTVSYLGREEFAPAGARQAVLQERYGFACGCARCQLESQAPRQLQQQLLDTYRQVMQDLKPRFLEAVEHQDQSNLAAVQAQLQTLEHFLSAALQQHRAVLSDSAVLVLQAAVYDLYELLLFCEQLLPQGNEAESKHAALACIGRCLAILNCVSKGAELHVFLASRLLQHAVDLRGPDSAQAEAAAQLFLEAHRMRYGSQLEQQVQLELMEANKQAAEEFLM
ncbi:hypothetical protein OEZ85_005832 [Tetradesmus obliquus]|uniref:SET domain-containing protein n=1 Tax=Tetradesmus obliquus TaxID=3088 RepID=A0ABY8UEZ4_TETOB|nr:hypothetical protein OEZ85_005832 [Tetradesmus obliquus]